MARGTHMILFIDDEPEKLIEYDEALRETGFKVKWVEDAEEGMKCFLENISRIDAVILDIMMPPPAILGDGVTDFGMRTGIKILDRIREETENIPVMIFTNLSLSRLKLPTYKFVELREKRETPPFALPKLLSQLIIKAKEQSTMPQDMQEDENARIVIKGSIQAQQIYIGNHGNQKMLYNQWNSKEEVLNDFLKELHELIDQHNDDEARNSSMVDAMENLENTFHSSDPDRTQVAGAVGRFVRLAPWTKSKFEELIMSVAGSLLGGGIIEGIKYALSL